MKYSKLPGTFQMQYVCYIFGKLCFVVSGLTSEVYYIVLSTFVTLEKVLFSNPGITRVHDWWQF
jgi:hypothetical protein